MTYDGIDTSDWTLEDILEHQRHTAETVSIMFDLKLNVMFTTMLHYDLPWLDVHVSDHYDALAVQQRLLDHGPSPVLMRKADEANRQETCDDCGATYVDEPKHFLGCPTWGFNRKGKVA